MARVALLIGTGEYSQGLKGLPAAPRDVAALETVLGDSARGGFNQVKTLINRQHSEISETIETWFRQHTADDLALLYISGHGVKDTQLDLYFAACNTRKVQEELVVSTAVSARFVHECSRRSKAKRQVIVLDCCFSGAYGNWVPRDDDSIDLQAILGQEGRVVLTSSSSVQYAFEQRDGELSIYTHHLVEGIRTGAADLDGDGAIAVGELHQYASRNVQEASPAMNPKIIVLKDEGYLIRIAKAPLGDPRVKYRKEVGVIAEEDAGEISFINQACLEDLRRQYGLNPEEAEKIEFEVLEPYRQRQAKLERYRQVFTQAIETTYPLREKDRNALKRLQRVLGFRDEDVKEIEESAIELWESSQRKKQTSAAPNPATLIHKTVNDDLKRLKAELADTDDLSSEKNIDYTQLRDRLKAGDWKEADEETYRTMIRVVGKKEGDYFSSEELLNFRCADLKTIDALWVKYSNGKFGFSVQKKIYLECGGKTDGQYPGDTIWHKFCDRVGWCENAQWIDYSAVIFNTFAPDGHIPVRVFGKGVRSLPFFGWKGVGWDQEVSLFSHQGL